MESIYEYGSRAGVWRLLREFEKRRLPLTVFAIGMALERNPEAARAFVELGLEIACHGYRWIHYQSVPEDIEREHRSEEHPSELQSLMRISYAVLCLKKKKHNTQSC